MENHLPNLLVRLLFRREEEEELRVKIVSWLVHEKMAHPPRKGGLNECWEDGVWWGND